nr:MAG TPA: hypothetical protein [Caudoviricetes sp.]
MTSGIEHAEMQNSFQLCFIISQNIEIFHIFWNKKTGAAPKFISF